MTSISVTEPAALLILQQTSAQSARKEEDEARKTDLVKVANGISGEPAKETLKAAFAVSAAFMELDAKSELASAAMTFIDSDQFKVADPTVKATLKGLIAEKGWEFMQLAKQQQEAHDGLSREDLFAIVLPQMISRNRDRFSDDEIEIAVKFKDKQKGGVVVFIPDSKGNSTYRDLTAAMAQEEKNTAAGGDKTALRELQQEYDQLASGWSKVLGIKPGQVPPMFVSVDDVDNAAWLKSKAEAAKAPGTFGPNH